jgi:hypothetical protein
LHFLVSVVEVEASPLVFDEEVLVEVVQEAFLALVVVSPQFAFHE